jgi:hypothetical protein
LTWFFFLFFSFSHCCLPNDVSHSTPSPDTTEEAEEFLNSLNLPHDQEDEDEDAHIEEDESNIADASSEEHQVNGGEDDEDGDSGSSLPNGDEQEDGEDDENDGDADLTHHMSQKGKAAFRGVFFFFFFFFFFNQPTYRWKQAP